MKKGRRDYHLSFVALERRTLFKCESWRQLSARAKIFYLYLKAGYNGQNNGQIQLHFGACSDLPELRSRKSFYGAGRELEASGWIERTNQGGLFRNPNTYRLTGKFDAML